MMKHPEIIRHLRDVCVCVCGDKAGIRESERIIPSHLRGQTYRTHTIL